MGRTLTPPQNPYTALIAGENISGGDVIMQSGMDYKAYTAKAIPVAVVSSGGSAIYSQTGLGLSSQYNNDNRCQVLQGADGSIYTIEPYTSGGAGIVLKKFTSEGAFLASVNVATSGGYIWTKAVFLSSGDIAIVGNSNPTIAFAIVTTSLTITKAITSISGLSGVGTGGNKLYVFPISTGGFSVVAMGGGAKLATISNTGTVTTSATGLFGNYSTWWFASAGMLSNGNIVISSFSDIDGAQYGIFTTTGATVQALTTLPGSLAASSVYAYSEVSSVAGYFAIAYAGTSNYQTLAVFNNSGTLQGTQSVPWTSPQMGANNQLRCKLINDGASFYWIDQSTSTSKTAKITTAGTMTLGLSYASMVGYFDAVFNTKMNTIDVVYLNGTTYYLAHIPTSTWGSGTVLTYTLSMPSVGYGAGQQGIMMATDGTLLFVDALFNNMGAMYLASFKQTDASVVGIAAGAASAGSTVYVNSAPGSYPTTASSSSAAKRFNHTGAAIAGVSGQIFPSSLTISPVISRNIN